MSISYLKYKTVTVTRGAKKYTTVEVIIMYRLPELSSLKGILHQADSTRILSLYIK